MNGKIIIRNGFFIVRQVFLLARMCGVLVLFIAFFCVFEASASLVSVSVSGTANTTAMGYTQGESYNFTWIVNDGYTGSTGGGDENDKFDSTKNKWFSRLVADPWLWTSVSGDGLTGTYSRPSGYYAAPYDQLLTDGNGLRFWAGDFRPSSSTMGLLVNGVEVYDVIAYNLTIPSLDYSDAAFINPATYLGSYIGTYTSTGGGIYLDDEGGNNIEFTTTGVIIAAVPEPSTVLLFGLGGIGAWLLRRNRIKSREDVE